MLLNLLLVVVGIALVLWGADKMTNGAVVVAQKLNIPEFVIGLTVIAIGTSAPEFVVSLMSAVKGTPDLAVGNVLGSNIFNTLMIVGVTAIICPMPIKSSTVKRDIPFAIIAAALLFTFAFDNFINRWESAILFALLIIFMIQTIKQAKGDSSNAEQTDNQQSTPQYPIWKAILFIVIGIACLIYGSDLFVDNASAIAKNLGVSEAVIGLTIVACGTSLPELATSIVAARKGQSDMAIGNVVGSNIFNIFLIIGFTGLICPMKTNGITTIDLGVSLYSIVSLWLFSYTKLKIERWEGAILALSIVAYMGFLIYNATHVA